MKAAKILSCVFALLSALLLALTVMVSLRSLDAPVYLAKVSREALELTEDFSAALAEGDYTQAGQFLLGQPQLDSREPEGELSVLVWKAYKDSLSCEFAGECYVLDSGIARDLTVTMLDIPGVMQQLKESSEDLLQKAAEGQDPAEIYDENDEFREEFVMEVLCDGAAQLLQKEPLYTSRQVTLNLICQDGSWWICPDQALLDVLSGGMGR